MAVHIDVSRLRRDVLAKNVPPTSMRVIERISRGSRYGDEDHEETVIERLSAVEALGLAAVLTAAAGAVADLTAAFSVDEP